MPTALPTTYRTARSSPSTVSQNKLSSFRDWTLSTNSTIDAFTRSRLAFIVWDDFRGKHSNKRALGSHCPERFHQEARIDQRAVARRRLWRHRGIDIRSHSPQSVAHLLVSACLVSTCLHLVTLVKWLVTSLTSSWDRWSLPFPPSQLPTSWCQPVLSLLVCT